MISQPTPTESESPKDSQSYEHARHWANVFLGEFAKETDRAAVIVAASVIDNALLSVLRQHLVPNAASTDELFEGANAPIGTFSAKIALAHRMGLISSPFARNLHLIRRIRNEFAHNIHGCSFEDSAIKARVMELYKSQKYRSKGEGSRLSDNGPRGNFLVVCMWMLWTLNARVERTIPLPEGDLEFGFTCDETFI